MNRMMILIIGIAMLILITACVQNANDPLVQIVSTPTSEPGGNEVQLQYEGIGPLEITPAPGDGESAAAPSAGQVNGIISSSGQQSTNELSSGEPGQIESVAPGDFNFEQDASLPVNWLTYHDQEYSFSINYPDIYTILPETATSMEGDLAAVHQVRFLDIQLASGDATQFELPNFTITVFELGDQSLEAFVAKENQGGEVEAYTGRNLTGYRVYYNQLMAPNEFYYFSTNGYVYKLTPLGPNSQEMLHSFKIE
jgi:hypothetical protein